ncbi:MAG: hypothetical protein KatS3mg125_1748 [Lysobacterales bacterium]|jgi:hypothetical protein|nr:MAG: hypothetical protein KatS3mg125_1748 [Xanthomonadales bacterium]
MRYLSPIALVLALTIAPAGVSQPRRDVLLIERVAVEGVERPANGMRMDEVERRFGAPERRHPPVGEPPIARWVYPAFTVYFEHDRVIYSVLNRSRPEEKGPRPPR